MKINEKINNLLTALNQGVFEKEEVIRLCLLSAVAGESAFLLGPPGVAKSLVARRLKFAFRDASSFEYLMNRFSTPDEIFGPVSISKLKNEDKFERNVKNYLPDATVVFLDEIWKAGPSIQNALLTVLNEKIYRNGQQEVKVPMKVLISASNELPMKNQGLEALWDRFLLRLYVEGVSDTATFNKMISEPLNSYEDNISDELKISDEEFNSFSAGIEKVAIPEYVFNVIHMIREKAEAENKKEKAEPIYISDRRWRKIVRLLRTSAFLNGRTEVDLMDCFLISDCIWNEEGQRKKAGEIVRDAVRKYGYKLDLDFSQIQQEIKNLENDVQEQTSKPKKIETPKVHYEKYYLINDLPYALIKIEDYTSLSHEYNHVYLFENSPNEYHRKNYHHRYSIKLSNRPNNIVYDGQMKKVDTESHEEIEYFIPHPILKKEWDNQCQKILKEIQSGADQLQQFKDKDLAHLKTNLFVDTQNAEIVENNITDTQKALEKLRMEVARIKHYYENVGHPNT